MVRAGALTLMGYKPISHHSSHRVHLVGLCLSNSLAGVAGSAFLFLPFFFATLIYFAIQSRGIERSLKLVSKSRVLMRVFKSRDSFFLVLLPCLYRHHARFLRVPASALPSKHPPSPHLGNPGSA